MSDLLRLVVDPRTPDPGVLDRAALALRDGQIVAYPTDTLYGLAVDPRQPDAIRRVFRVKARSGTRALPLVAADLPQVVTALGPLTPSERRLAEAFWPGPLTIVIRAGRPLAAGAMGEDGTVAVRVPAHEVARGLARAAGHPVTATSANVSGGTSLASAEDVVDAIGGWLALILDAGPTAGGPPSTIVQVGEEGPRLLRAGAIPFGRVLELLQ